MIHSIRGNSKLFGILGNPIQHSLSPIVHNILLQQTEYAKHFGTYIPLQCELEHLENVLNTIKALSFIGINVTSPYKKKVIPLLDELSPLSKSIKSVNTIYWKNQKLCGTSTDGLGFIQGFKRKGFSFKNKVVAILGSGGVSRAILESLHQQKCSKIILVSRTPKTDQPNIQTISYEQYSDFQKQIDIVVNCTPLGMGQNSQSPLKSEQLESHQCVYDLIYNKPTVLLQQANKKNISHLNGLNMLIYQAIASFKIWTNITAIDEEIIFKQVEMFLKEN